MKNIALAFSGGGFRAAAFSLGTLSYLDRLKTDGKPGGSGPSVLQSVTFIGSTSGGSLANIAYSLAVYQGRPLSEVYKQLLEMMDGEELVKRVFAIFNDAKRWEGRPDKSRNLINAFAVAYDELFGRAQFGELFDPKDGVTPHVEEVCINATEFTNGLSFRFQSQKANPVDGKNGKIGNNYIYFKNAAIGGKLRLGDLMASSSCFSGGFEPVIFPDDFTYAGLDKQTLTKDLYFQANPFTINENANDFLADEDFHKEAKRFGMMDGGVADNQAIDSIYRANARRAGSGKTFDLVILTDVTSYLLDGYTLPMEKRHWYTDITLQQAINLLKLTGVFFLVLLGLVIFSHWSDWIRLLFIPAAFSALAYVYGAWKLRQAKKNAWKKKSTWLIVVFTFINNFLMIRYSRVKQMISSRLKSVFLLADDIYLKQIRRLYYDKIFSDPVLSKITVKNAIYDLSKVKQRAQDDNTGALKKEARFETLSEAPPESIPKPSGQLINVAEQARLMPTTLWFDPFQKDTGTLKAIVATGQFTVCYNLLKYLVELGGNLPVDLSAMKDQLFSDWTLFIANPYFMYDQLDPFKNCPVPTTEVPV